MRIEIELRQMQYFLAVAQERSFTRAATRCHVAQSSLSRQIHAMEETLGARLFERLPRDVRITAAGKVFEKEAASALEHTRRAASLVRALDRGHKGALRVGLSVMCDLPRVRKLIEAAREAENQISVECVTGYSSELCLALLRGRLDFAVVDVPIRDRHLRVLPIYSEPLLAVLPRGHHLAARPIVRSFEIRKERFVCISRQVDPGFVCIEAMLRGAEMDATSLTRTSNIVDLLDDVAMHQSIGLVRCSAGRLRRDGVVYKPFIDSVSLETAIVWRKEHNIPHTLSFRNALIAFSREPLRQ